MPSRIVIECSKAMANQKMTIAFAESATAGRLSAEFSLTPDSGTVLKGGLVCYDACLKEDILGIPPDIIKKYTPESAEITEELARRLSNIIQADIYVAITGLTTPGGSETPEKPVGTMFIHALIKGKPVAVREIFRGTPEEMVLQVIDKVASTILDKIQIVM